MYLFASFEQLLKYFKVIGIFQSDVLTYSIPSCEIKSCSINLSKECFIFLLIQFLMTSLTPPAISLPNREYSLPFHFIRFSPLAFMLSKFPESIDQQHYKGFVNQKEKKKKNQLGLCCIQKSQDCV